jgi:nucleoside-diphosphate kinase
MAEIQKTVVLLKPDALQRDLLGEIISRFERKGLKIVAMKFIRLTNEMLDVHYSHHAGKAFFESLKQFMMQTPVVGLVLEGIDAVPEVRKLIGATNPRAADAGTIRADLCMNVPSNLIHASDSLETAQEEIKRFFKENELFFYQKITDLYHFGEGV